MTGSHTITVQVIITSNSGKLDGDDAQEFTFTFTCGYWKVPLQDIAYEKAMSEVERRFPGEEIISIDVIRTEKNQ